MILLKKNFNDFYNAPNVIILLLHIAFEIDKNNFNPVLSDQTSSDNCCIIKPSDLPDFSRYQYRLAIEKLTELAIIKTIPTPKGNQIWLLENDYFSIENPTEEKPNKNHIENEIQTENHETDQQQQQTPPPLTDQPVKKISVKKTKISASVQPQILPDQPPEITEEIKSINNTEKAALIGVPVFEVKINKPEYIKGGIPAHLLGSLTPVHKTEYFEALKEELINSVEYLNKLAFECNVEVPVLTEELIKYMTETLWENKKYAGGLKVVKKIFENHSKKHFLPKKETEKQRQGNKLHPRFVETYFHFITEILKNPKPQFGSREGKSIKSLISYFINACEGNEENAVLAFQTMFSNWNKLPSYYNDKFDINYIALNIQKIIYHLKNGKSTNKNNGIDDLEAEIKRRYA